MELSKLHHFNICKAHTENSTSFQANSNAQRHSSTPSTSTFQAPAFKPMPVSSQATFSPAPTAPVNGTSFKNNQTPFSPPTARASISPASPAHERTRSASWAPTAQKINSNGVAPKKKPPPPPAGKPTMSPLLSRRQAASPAPSFTEQSFNPSPRNSSSSQQETFKSSFSELQIGSPMTQRKLSNPPAKPEIELRSPQPKVSNFSLQWDQTSTASNNFHTEPEPESNSINIEDVSCHSERQPDIVVDFDMKSPVPSYLNGSSCQAANGDDEQFQEDTASVTSFNSEVFEQQQAIEQQVASNSEPPPPAGPPAAPTCPPPAPEPVEENNQMTPTANLMANAFKVRQ